MSNRAPAVLLTLLLAALAVLAGPTAPASADDVTPGVHPLVTGLQADPGSGVSFRGRLYFIGYSDSQVRLWATDGTAGGTGPVSTATDVASLVVVGDRLLFSGTDQEHGNEWWTTDGTAAGTRLLADIYPGDRPSSPRSPVLLGGLLYFNATEPVHGSELWVTDGTSTGTRLAADVVPGPDSSFPEQLTALDDRVVFLGQLADRTARLSAFVPSTGSTVQLDTMPVPFDGSPRLLARVGSQVLFWASDLAHGFELWATSGQPGSVHMVSDIDPGPSNGGPDPILVLGGLAVFPSFNPDVGQELWVSDGTAVGTRLVRDIRPGPASSGVDDLVVLGGRLLFTADDGVHGRELWETQGTLDSTRLVADVRPGPEDGTELSTDGGATVAGQLLFAGRGADGLEPWVTDGSTAGTRELADLVPGPAGSASYPIGSLGNTLVLGQSFPTTDQLFTWTAVASSTSITVRRRYSAHQARHRRIRLPVTVTSPAGNLSGGTVTLTRRGRVVGTAPLVNGRAVVQLTARVRARHRYVVSAHWTGTVDATGSTSAEVRIRVRHRRHRH